MYNRSPRFGLKFPTATPPEVGPYTYMLDDPLQVNRVNVVPFGTTDSRKYSSVNERYTDAIYNVNIRGNIVGGHSLQNRAKRFVYTISETPPPGTYNPKLPEKRKQPRTPSGKGRVYYCRVPYSLLGSAPSIPTKEYADGYDIGKNGRIIKSQAVPVVKSIGPGTYNAALQTTTEDPYYGCRWSRRTSQRTMYKINDGPGPGHYDIAKVSTCRWDSNEEDYREMARRLTYLPRYTEQQQYLAKKQNFPAPCKYSKPSSFDYKPPVTTIIKPFISKKPRFSKVEERDGAFHADYDRTTSMDRRVTPSMKEIPFSFTAKRFQRKTKSEEDPEPGLHLPKGLAELVYEKNCKPFAWFRPPFDSTVRRDFSFVASDSHSKPNCATYPREKTATGNKIQHGHSVFQSTTDRTKPIYSMIPPPSKYSITEGFNKTRDAISHNKKKVSFQAASERETVKLAFKDNPGPADYIGKDGIKGKGHIFDKTVRFEEKICDVPPPDHYYIHPLYGESIYIAKNTFNLHIAESVLRKKLRVPPNDSYKEFMKTMKKKKKLRCFTTFKGDEIHKSGLEL